MKAASNRTFSILFSVGFLVGGIVLTFSILRSFQYGWHATGIFHTAMYTFAIGVFFLRRRLPERVALGLFMGLLAVTAAHALCTFGLAREGLVFLFFLFPLFISALLIVKHIDKKNTDVLNTLKRNNEELRIEISAKSRIENALRESEARYRSIIENIPVAFSIVQDGRFRFVNSNYCDMTGYTYDEIVDKLGPEDMVSSDHRNRIAQRYHRLLSGESTPDNEELIIVRKDGTRIPVNALASSFTFLGKPAIFGSLVDITNEKQLESKLIQSQKMEAIGTLAGGIAHDFNNILSALMGFATMLHMALEDKNPLKRYTTNILSASERAAGLTQSLLTFSRSEPVELKSLNINTTINETEDLLRRVITEDIDFKIKLSQEPIHIRADAIQINQILFNLVANAMDAMSGGGDLEISTGIEELDELFILRNGFGRKGTYCRITVADSGAGMDEATINKIFDPFFTTKSIGKGTGLGLSTVYGIVKQHHGYIQVSSMPGRGTSFHIYFPAISRSPEVKNSSLRNFRKGQETILVAEDDTITRCFIRDLLTHYGYKVVEAEDGEDALIKFQSHPEISLLILDAIMPGKNGQEAYDAIQEKHPGIPALFISGYPREIVLSKVNLDPSMAFISKPLYPDKLMEKIEEILDGAK
jgi:PAS domain S-box-containing protein